MKNRLKDESKKKILKDLLHQTEVFWEKGDFVIKWRNMNTERGDKKLNKTKQSQKKGILNVGRCKKKKVG